MAPWDALGHLQGCFSLRVARRLRLAVCGEPVAVETTRAEEVRRRGGRSEHLREPSATDAQRLLATHGARWPGTIAPDDARVTP